MEDGWEMTSTEWQFTFHASHLGGEHLVEARGAKKDRKKHTPTSIITLQI